MSGTRQKIQYSLALKPVDRGETPVSGSVREVLQKPLMRMVMVCA